MAKEVKNETPAQTIGKFLGSLVAALILYALWILLMIQVAKVIFVIGLVIFAFIVFGIYVRSVFLILVFEPSLIDNPTGSEPAFKQYYFTNQVWADYWGIVRNSSGINIDFMSFMWMQPWEFGKRKVSEWETKSIIAVILLLWPIFVTYYLVIAASTVGGAFSYLIFGLLHFIAVGICIAAVYTVAGILIASEWLFMVVRRIKLRCPHKLCHKRIKLPHYACPNCHTLHKKLLPGSYGIRKRQCKCGVWLPTLTFNGRGSLISYCPHAGCGTADNPDSRLLDPGQQTTASILVTLAGGVSAGKTTFFTAALIDLHKKADEGFASLAFTNRSSREMYAQNLQDFQNGKKPEMTRHISPDAFLIGVNTGARDHLLSFYDASGELFKRPESLGCEEYYSDVHGIIFLIDPFSLQKVRERLGKEIDTDIGLGVSLEKPSDIYRELVQTVQRKMGRIKIKRPVSIVLTKTDAFGVGNEIDAIALATPPPEPMVPGYDSESNAVRTWLEKYGEKELISKIEADFKKFHYFKCSALGRSPGNNSIGFVSQGAFGPLEFILYNNGLDFKKGNSNKRIAKFRTEDAEVYVAESTNLGETRLGRLVAAAWGACIILVAAIVFIVVRGEG